MIVTYFGGTCFRLQSGDISLLVDAENNRLKADVYLKTLTPAAGLKEIESESGVAIAFPGEYEVKGIDIKGIPIEEESTAAHIKTAYLITWEGITAAFLGHIAKTPSAQLIDALNEPDLLFLPAGSPYLEPEAAARLVKLLEPALAFPSFSKNATEFLKAMGQKAAPEEKISFRKKDLLTEKNKVVILKGN